MRSLRADEAAVIEAAKELCQLWRGMKHIPTTKARIEEAEAALDLAMGELDGEFDGDWNPPRDL